jgi:hypothetical protein
LATGRNHPVSSLLDLDGIRAHVEAGVAAISRCIPAGLHKRSP